MFVKVVTFVTILTFAAAAENKWAWKNIAEPQCNKYKCYNNGHQMKLKPLGPLFAKRRYVLMAIKLFLSNMNIGIGNRRMIKTDQDLYELAPFTFKTYLSWKMKNSYANWTFDKTVTGSLVDLIQGNAINSQYMTSSSIIRKHEDSVFGDGSSTYKVIWADDKSLLFVWCFGSEGYSGWDLYSTSPTLSKTTRKILVEKMPALGFNPKRAVVLPH